SLSLCSACRKKWTAPPCLLQRHRRGKPPAPGGAAGATRRRPPAARAGRAAAFPQRHERGEPPRSRGRGEPPPAPSAQGLELLLARREQEDLGWSFPKDIPSSDNDVSNKQLYKHLLAEV
ncbi:unnamed protein product, partial [Urochloa humidicola]